MRVKGTAFIHVVAKGIRFTTRSGSALAAWVLLQNLVAVKVSLATGFYNRTFLLHARGTHLSTTATRDLRALRTLIVPMLPMPEL